MPPEDLYGFARTKDSMLKLVGMAVRDVRQFDKHLFFKFKAAPDIFNATGNYILKMDKGSTFYSSKQQYEDPVSYKSLEDYVSSLLSLHADMHGMPKSDIALRTKDVIDFDMSLNAAVTFRESDARIPPLDNNFIKNSELKQQLSSIMNVKEFTAIWRNLGTYINGEDTFTNIRNLDLIKNVTEVIFATNRKVVIDYILVNTLQVESPILGPEITYKALDWRRNTKGDISLGVDDQCYRWMLDTVPWAISKAVVENGNPKESATKRELAQRIVSDIKTWFHDAFDNAEWLKTLQHEGFNDKLDTLHYEVGWPDWLTDEKEADIRLTSMYARELPSPITNYLPQLANTFKSANAFSAWAGLSLSLSISKTQWDDSRIGTKIDRSIWPVLPHDANAEAKANINSFYLPYAVMQEPGIFTNWEEDDVSKLWSYGAMGSVIAHEISHIFDDTGRYFDMNGQLMLTDIDYSDYNTVIDCITKEYSSMSFEGEDHRIFTIDGSKSRGENIADLGGLSVVYRATIDGKIVPEDELQDLIGIADIPKSMVPLLAFGSFWCEAATDEYFQNLISNDVHPPGAVRIAGVYHNMSDIAKQMQCESGTILNPSKNDTSHRDRDIPLVNGKFHMESLAKEESCILYYN